ncbi:hypothetical protein IW261DRAFT_1515552 [Armillaria novae-zelandiae]|uniref:Post-SET domain-containing protein n=1 Tax=Armillaria novae-zelandiae TaxID=153914 RepID=A0AA39TUU6_9AGAR|nr:hypothetical protein IW261DRAFT_1515552 [Armillaria novae-zelandiae]
MSTPSRHGEDSDSDNPLYLWSRSPTPEENFSGAEGADEHGNWPVSIVSEEVGHDNEVRCIRWDTWRREDGTNNTYTEQDVPPAYLKSHTTQQQKKRQRMARESRDIEIWSSTDIINTRTRLRAQAYEEKLALTKDEPIPISDKLWALLFDKGVPPQKQPTPERTDSDAEGSDASGSSNGGDFGLDLLSTPPPSSRLRNRTVSSTASGVQSVRKLPGSAQRPRAPTVSSLSSSSKRKGKEKQVPGRVPSTSSASTVEEGAIRSLPHRSTRREGSLNIRALSSASIGLPKASIPKSSRPLNVGYGAGSFRVISSNRPFTTHAQTSEPLRTVKRKRSLTASETSSPRPTKRLEKLPQRLSPREVLQRYCTLEAAKASAAVVTFVNEVDDEETPELDKNFVYLEREYTRGAGAPDPVDDALLTVCTCRTCTGPSSCGCQADSQVKRVRQNGEEIQIFAYSPKGLFTFNVESHVAVIECNKKKCGWGVRSSVDVERGKVIGLYTGPRAVANKSIDQSFIFALDFTEDGNEPEEEGAYSVDSTVYGEIPFLVSSTETRLTPHVKRKLDALFEMRTPYVAFVAKKRILASTEFTFDYCPTKGRNRCLCGASNCRGWLA